MEYKVEDVISTLKKKYKIQSSDYRKSGKYPIIDQGDNFIAGYINDQEKLISDNLPIIIFGDHTCHLKFIDFPFAPGADGIQLIVPKDPDQFDIYYLYYCLKKLGMNPFGYQRHMKYLKASKILWRPMNEQKDIGQLIFKYEKMIQINLLKNIQLKSIQSELIARIDNRDLDFSNLISLK